MCCTGLSTGLFWFGFPWYLLGTYIIGMSCTCSICLTFKRFIFPIHVERTYQTSITFKELTGMLGNISLTCLNRNDLNTFLDTEYNKFCNKEKVKAYWADKSCKVHRLSKWKSRSQIQTAKQHRLCNVTDIKTGIYIIFIAAKTNLLRTTDCLLKGLTPISIETKQNSVKMKIWRMYVVCICFLCDIDSRVCRSYPQTRRWYQLLFESL